MMKPRCPVSASLSAERTSNSASFTLCVWLTRSALSTNSVTLGYATIPTPPTPRNANPYPARIRVPILMFTFISSRLLFGKDRRQHRLDIEQHQRSGGNPLYVAFLGRSGQLLRPNLTQLFDRIHLQSDFPARTAQDQHETGIPVSVFGNRQQGRQVQHGPQLAAQVHHAPELWRRSRRPGTSRERQRLGYFREVDRVALPRQAEDQRRQAGGDGDRRVLGPGEPSGPLPVGGRNPLRALGERLFPGTLARPQAASRQIPIDGGSLHTRSRRISMCILASFLSSATVIPSASAKTSASPRAPRRSRAFSKDRSAWRPSPRDWRKIPR